MSDYILYDDELYHHGIKGQKWGVRRYQNADGTLTEAGKKRHAKLDKKIEKLEKKRERNQRNRTARKIRVGLESNGDYVDTALELMKVDRTTNRNDARYGARIARAKAKKDPSYKETEEYQQAMAKYGSEVAAGILMGDYKRKPKST